MKALKIVGGILVGVIALVAILLVVALTPAVQTWAVRKAVAGQPGLKLDVSRVSAGFSAADLSDVHVVQDGVDITVKHVSAKYSAWDFISHKRVTVDDLTVEDLVVDLRHAAATPVASTGTKLPGSTASNPQPAKPAGQKPAAPFNGILNQAQLPFDLQIARFSVPGRALLPDDQTVAFELRGSDITTGRKGTVDWKVDVTNAHPKAPFTALHNSGTAQVHITTEKRIDLAEINSVASVEGPRLPADQVKIVAKLEQPAAGGNEGYSANVLLVRGATTDQLATLAGQYDATKRELSGAWTIAVRSEQVAALLSGLGLPDVAIDGSGKFSARPDTGAASSSGELRSDISHLEKASPQLAAIGGLRVQVTFGAAIDNNVAQLDQFSLEATAADGRRLAEIRVLQRIGYSLADSKVSFADPKADLARISVQRLPLAWAQPFIKGMTIDSGDLSLAFAVAAAADGSEVRVSPVEPVLVRNVTVRNGTQRLADQLTLSVKPQAQYSPDRVHAELNDLSVTMPSGDSVAGRMTADITHLSTAPVIAFTTDTNAKFVAALKPYLNVETGPIAIVTKSEGSLSGQTMQFTRSSTRLDRVGGAMLASIDLQQPVSFNLQTNAVFPSKPDAETLRIRLGEVPLSWAEPFVADSRIGGQLAGGTISIGVKSIDDIAVATTEPIAIRGITVAMKNQPMLQNVDVLVDLTARKQGEVVRYNLRRVEARQGATSLATLAVAGEARLGKALAVAAKGTLDADVAALLQQPVAAGSVSLARGTLTATFDANVADKIQANGRIATHNLTAKQNNQALGDAELSLTATVQSDGSSLLKIPFTLTNGSRKSDVALEGRLARAGNAVTFDGRISSSLLVVDDLQMLAALAPASPGTPTAAAPAKPGPAVAGPKSPRTPANGPVAATTPTKAPPVATSPADGRDTQAFWAAFGGKIEVDLKEIKYGRDYVISGVRGSVAITPRELALNALEGKLKDDPFKVSAKVDFDATRPQPYTLAATANVTNFDIGAFLQSTNPGEKPQLETKVTVDAKIAGKGTSVGNLGLNAYGTFDVTGSQGVLRALANKSGQAVSGLSAVAGIVGGLMGKQGIAAGAQLAGLLAEMPFDQFTMHVERGTDLNLKIGHIEFKSPITRIVGEGGITNQPGVPIQNQPLKLTLSLAGKEGMAYAMNQAGLLSGSQDDQGYSTMSTSFTLSGTPSSPNSNDLWRIVAEQAAKAAAGHLFGR